MFRFFRRALAVLVLLAALAALKHGYPATMLQALTGDNASILTEFAENLDGKPLSGSGDVVRAVGEGEPVRDAVEVFCEDLRAGA